MIDARSLVGSHDIFLITLDSLRYDVARDCLAVGQTPHLAGVLPDRKWEERHSPGSFTYATHQAIFGGFFPTPVSPGKHSRPFALQFPGSETISSQTCVLDAPDLVTGLAAVGYHTVCIGGVGFFNKRTALGRVLPGLFGESFWSPELGVTEPRSTENQVALAVELLKRHPTDQRIFLFVNISAIHQPNYFYLDGETHDSIASHAAALTYVDKHLGQLFQAIRRRGPSFGFVCSDHGTAYGEDGFVGHRLGHSVVWTVPYAEFAVREVAP